MTYETDLAMWAKQQAELLRRRAANEIDWDNLADEIEAVGRSERREIRSRLEVLLVHMLKWRFQPDLRSNSWRASIRDARTELDRVLEDNPSLRSLPAESLPKVYASARAKALDETGLYHLPETCEWSAEQVLDIEFWPT